MNEMKKKCVGVQGKMHGNSCGFPDFQLEGFLSSFSFFNKDYLLFYYIL